MRAPAGFVVTCVLLSCASFARSETSGGATKGAREPAIIALDPELKNYDYPFPVSFHEIPSPGQKLRMAYMDVAAGTDAAAKRSDAADKNAAPNANVVVLLHGKNFSGAYWAPTMDLLTKQGYRVIAPDQIGFGKSSKPAGYAFSFHALAANTRALLDSLGVHRFGLVGHSMGGMLAVRMALMHPERVERLVLVNPIGLEDWKLVVPYRTVEENFAQEMRATPESIREYQRLNYFGGEWKPEYDALTEILSGWTRHPDYHVVAWDAALTSDMIFTQPVLYEFDRLKVPTLLIIGQRDRTAIGKDRVPEDVASHLGDYSALGMEAAKRISGATLVEIPEAGHLPQVDAFEKYSKALLEFLGR
jgi:pimeloyl-ACP methyl ester carboxylesterase